MLWWVSANTLVFSVDDIEERAFCASQDSVSIESSRKVHKAGATVHDSDLRHILAAPVLNAAAGARCITPTTTTNQRHRDNHTWIIRREYSMALTMSSTKTLGANGGRLGVRWESCLFSYDSYHSIRCVVAWRPELTASDFWDKQWLRHVLKLHWLNVFFFVSNN